MKKLMNKLFNRSSAANIAQEDTLRVFDHEIKRLVGTILPRKAFENQLETRILQLAAAENNTKSMSAKSKSASWLQMDTPLKKFSIAGLAIVLLIAVSLTVSPSIRVMAANLFSFWTRVDNRQVVTPLPDVSAVDPEEIPALVESLQAEIKSTQQATAANAEEEFIIKLPTLLPEGHRILVVERSPKGNGILDLSRGRSGVLVTVTIQPAVDAEGTILGPIDKVEKVTIDGITYEYVRGGWGIGNAFSSQMDPEDVKNLAWIDDYDGIHKLRWFDGNLNYYMLVAGSSMPGTDWYLGKHDMVKIASSFRPLENGTRPPLAYFKPDHGMGEKTFENIQDIAVLESLVRFDIPEPSVLPGKFTFNGGRPVFTGDQVIMSYTCQNDAGGSGLLQEIEFDFTIGRYSESQLAKELEMFGGVEVGDDAVIETIPINGVEVQYLKGGWTYNSEIRIWDNDQNTFKLIWYQDGFLYQINSLSPFTSDGSCAITKESWIKFIEGLK